MPEYNSKGAQPAYPIMEAFSQNGFPPKIAEVIAKEIPNLLGATLRHPSNQSSFREGQVV
jgi:hypothetical protein